MSLTMSKDFAINDDQSEYEITNLKKILMKGNFFN